MLKRLTLIVTLLLALTVSIGASDPAAAQTQTQSKADHGQSKEVEPAQIKELLSTLKNDAEREALISKLETLLAASEQGETKEEPLPVEATISGVVVSLSKLVERGIAEVSGVVIALTDVNSLLPGITVLTEDPEDLIKLGRWGFIFLLVAGVGLVGARLAGMATRRFITRLEDWMAAGTLLRSCVALVPLVALRSIRAGVFLAISQAIVTVIEIETALLLAGRVFAFAIAAQMLCLAIMRTLLHPAGMLTRILEIQPSTAAYLEIWSNRIIATGIYGILGLQGAQILGMPAKTYLFLDKIVYALIWFLLVVFILQNRSGFAHFILEKSARASNRLLWSMLAASWHLWAIALVTIRIVTQLSNPETVEFKLIEVLVILTGILIFWRLTWRFIDLAGLRAFSVSRDLTDKYPSLEKRANVYLPHLLGAAKTLVSVISIGALLQIWGIPIGDFATSETGRALVQTLTTVVVVIGGAVLTAEMIGIFIERRLHVLDIEGRLGGRERTLLPLIRNALLVVIAVLTAFFVLTELGIDITPLLAGAGVVGLAVGFGAQSLVKDVISGVFLLIEDTLNVGDYVDVGGKTGTVEALSIRTLRLRDVAGDMHTIPFGSVDTITNMTKDFAYALVDVGIAYREDADAVMKLLNEIGSEMVEDEKIKPSITGPFEVFGVQDLADSSVNIRTRVKTKGGMQWSVRREFLRRVKRRFDAEGIEIPFPHQTLYFGVDKNGAAPPAFVQVSQQVRGRKSDKDGAESGKGANGYFETANPEMADAEAARNAEKEAQEVERRKREEERSKASEAADEAKEDLAHEDPAKMDGGDDGVRSTDKRKPE